METRREVVLRLADVAEDLGYSAFTVAEGWGYDAGVLLAEIATRTSRIELGTGVLNVWGRSPASIAMLASGLHAVVRRPVHPRPRRGQPAARRGPARRRVPGAGATARGDGPAGARRCSTASGRSPRREARGLRLAAPAPVPLHLAALGSGRRAAGGRGRRRLGAVPAAAVRAEGTDVPAGGRRRAGRAPAAAGRAGLPAALSPEVAAWWVAFYLTSMGPLYATSLRSRGSGRRVDAVVAANGRGVPPTVPPAAPGAGRRAAAQPARGPRPLVRRGRRRAALVLPPGSPLDELESTLAAFRP
jgi:hypothetical protein